MTTSSFFADTCVEAPDESLPTVTGANFLSKEMLSLPTGGVNAPWWDCGRLGFGKNCAETVARELVARLYRAGVGGSNRSIASAQAAQAAS